MKMQKLKILNSKEKKELLKKIKEQFKSEIYELEEYIFLINPKNKIYLISKDFSKVDIKGLKINSLGMYFGEIYENQIRLSIEGSQLIGKKSKNILELNDKQAERWMKGEDIELVDKLNETGFIIIKNKEDYLGCGKLMNNKLFNYIPKERRI